MNTKMAQMITSRDNKLVKFTAKLIASKSFREEQRLFVLEGARLCADAAGSGVQAKLCFFTAQAAEKYPKQVKAAIACASESYQVSQEVAPRLSDTKTPQGLCLVCPMLDKQFFLDKIKSTGRYLLLEGLQDPGNIGTILRSADAFGTDGVILTSDCPDFYSPKMIRSTMGAFFRQPVFVVPDAVSCVRALKAAGQRVFASVLDEQAQGLSEVKFSYGSTVVIGNEGRGMSQELIAECTDKVYIEMAGSAESLNAAVAASIFLWEMQRQLQNTK